MSSEETKQDALNEANAKMAKIHRMVTALHMDWDRLEELREERDGYEDEELSDWPTPEARHHAWAEANPDDAEELKDLTDYANGWESEEQVREEIREDPLSIEVRSGWGQIGDEFTAAEFRIVLSTGGPHVEMTGELDHHREPYRAWLQYNGWFMPMTERINEPGDQEVLLEYASQFYFGE